MKPVYSTLLATALIACLSPSLHAADASNSYAPLTYTPMSNRGQALVDMEMAKHPELKILGIHVTPAGMSPDVDKERRLMFSSFGRIGKIDTDADSEIYQAGKEVVEVLKNPAPPSTNFSITATPKYEVLAPLMDQAGKKVGLIVMVFPYHDNFDLETYHAIAKAVTAELSSRTISKDDLFKPAS